MTDHSITPPPELVQQWQEESLDDPTGAYTQAIANRAVDYLPETDYQQFARSVLRRWG